MPSISIGLTHRDPDGSDKTGVRFNVIYDGGEVRVSIPEMPPVALATHQEDIPAFLRSLARATLDALDDPSTIHFNPPLR